VRFSYNDPQIDPTFYIPLARAVEEAGFDGYVVPDGFVYPREFTKIEMTAQQRASGVALDSRRHLEGMPFLDPFALVAVVGTATNRMRVLIQVLKLPIRQPVLVAKQAMTAAVLTNERFVLGIGTDPWREDYEVCDVPWEGRGRRADEMIDIIRGLSTGDYFEYHGEFFDFPEVKMAPAPRGALPIMVGGHGIPALRRAARVGDGWMYSGSDGSDVPQLVQRIQAFRREFGRGDKDFEVHVASTLGSTRDGVLRLQDMGVTDVVFRPRWPWPPGPDRQSLGEKLDAVSRYADEVIARIRG
jgi:probable F420-dependent oxidoreductase